jgi:hypothetical protein
MAVKERVKAAEEEEFLPAVIQGAQLPAEADDFDFGDYEGGGLDNVSVDELAMPFLIVLQANSPQCKPAKVGGVDGAKAGDLYNSATGELFDGEEGVGFLPCARDHKFIEFFPKEDDGSGGGFVSVRNEDDEQVLRLRSEQKQFGKIRHEGGAERSEGKYEPTEFVETYSLIGYTVTDWDDISTMSRVTLPLASSKIASYKNFMNICTGIKYRSATNPTQVRKPAMWSHRYRLRTKFKQRGTQSWYIVDIQLEERPSIKSFLPKTNPIFQIGAAMNDSFNAGAARVTYEKMETDAPANASDDVPF